MWIKFRDFQPAESTRTTQIRMTKYENISQNHYLRTGSQYQPIYIDIGEEITLSAV